MPLKAELKAKGWGDPDAADYREKNIVKLTRHGITIYVHKATKVIFEELLDGLNKFDVDMDKRKDDWGYANRDIRGIPGSKSWHSVGCAIDVNATENVLGSRNTTFPDKKTTALCKELGLTWGHWWQTSRPDPMHFEWNGSKADAEAKSLQIIAKRKAADKDSIQA